MAGRKLAVTVHVPQDDGSHKVYLAGDEVPAEDVKKIDNPDVWEGGRDEGDGEPKGSRSSRK